MVLPLIFLLVFALFDLGQWEFQGSQASAAARDGARAGLIVYKTAEGTTASPGGAGWTTVNNAVAGRLDRQTYTLTVACVGPLDETTKPCSTAEPDKDRIMVTVSWTRSPLTPVTSAFGAQNVSGHAVMKVAGAPE